MKKYQYFFALFGLLIISPLLFWLSWPPNTWTGLVFFAFIPYFFSFEYLVRQKETKRYFFLLLIFSSNLIWNILVTYWLYSISFTTGIAIQITNSTMFTIPWAVYSYADKSSHKNMRYILLISSWISLEYIQYYWLLSYPLLNIGNALSTKPQWIQFMEYTGVLGGTFWVLVSNLFLFKFFKEGIKKGFHLSTYTTLAKSVAVISFPLIFSLIIFNSYKEKNEKVNVLIIHPNVNCRTEKYTMSQEKLIDKYLNLTLEKVGPETDFILWPETAIPDLGWIVDLSDNKDLARIHNKLSQVSNANLITGGVLYEKSNEEGGLNINYHGPSKAWYRTYNAAISLSLVDDKLSIRTKEKLVPVEETIPNRIAYFLRKTFSSLGGFHFSHRANNTDIFINADGVSSLPLICYESLYGQFTSRKVGHRKGIIFVLLNEGWYRNIVGASQFMYASCIRAIENRRSIARSSNDGISCTINEKGQVENMISGFAPHAFNTQLTLNNEKTFYSIVGNYFGYLSIIVCVFCLFIVIFIKS
ncbi:MAG: apolipoprotein N-acyltransferase [Bacteroidota bacterium]